MTGKFTHHLIKYFPRETPPPWTRPGSLEGPVYVENKNIVEQQTKYIRCKYCIFIIFLYYSFLLGDCVAFTGAKFFRSH